MFMNWHMVSDDLIVELRVAWQQVAHLSCHNFNVDKTSGQ